MSRLLDTIRDLAQEGNSGEDAVSRIRREIGQFCGSADPFDDMALLLLTKCEYRPDPDWRSLPVQLSSFDQIKDDVFQRAGNTPETRKALVACEEALTNIVQYSGAKPLSFSCEKQGDELRTVIVLCLCLVLSGYSAHADGTEHKSKEEIGIGYYYYEGIFLSAEEISGAFRSASDEFPRYPVVPETFHITTEYMPDTNNESRILEEL